MSVESQRQERVHSQGKFYCRRDFKCGGRTWKAGEEFRWRTISISERRVLQMWNKRDITTEEEISREADDRKAQAEKRERYEAQQVVNRKDEPAPEPSVDGAVSADVETAPEPKPEPAPKPRKSRKTKAEAEDHDL